MSSICSEAFMISIGEKVASQLDRRVAGDSAWCSKKPGLNLNSKSGESVMVLLLFSC
jgi:hypothetical protein